MPKLVVFVPFARGEGADLKDVVSALEKTGAPGAAQPFSTNVGAIKIDSIQVVYLDEVNGQIGKGDVVLVNAHGGSKSAKLSVKESPKKWRDIGLADLWAALEKLGATNAATAIFYCCFSALAGHAAPAYKKKFGTPAVYGSPVECTGKDFFKLKRGSASGTLGFAIWTDCKGLTKF